MRTGWSEPASLRGSIIAIAATLILAACAAPPSAPAKAAESPAPSTATPPSDAPSAPPTPSVEPSTPAIGSWKQLSAGSVPYLHDLVVDQTGYVGPGMSAASSDAEPIAAIWRSADGIEWSEEPYEFATASDPEVVETLWTLVPTPTGYAGLGSAGYGIAMSDDGAVWTHASLEEGACPAALAARDDTVIAVGSVGPCGQGGMGDPAIWRLGSGGAWTGGQLPGNAGGWLHGVVATAEGFLAWGLTPLGADSWTCEIGCVVDANVDPYAGAPWLTTDGVEWKRVQDPAFAGAIIEGIASSDQTTVALGWLPSVDAPETYRVAMWTTEDGADWSRIDAVLPFGDVQQGMGIGIGGGGSALAVWVMANPAVTSHIWLSADGVRWDEGVELPIGTVMGVSSVGVGLIAYGTVQEADAGVEVPCRKDQVLAGQCQTVGSAWTSASATAAE